MDDHLSSQRSFFEVLKTLSVYFLSFECIAPRLNSIAIESGGTDS